MISASMEIASSTAADDLRRQPKMPYAPATKRCHSQDHAPEAARRDDTALSPIGMTKTAMPPRRTTPDALLFPCRRLLACRVDDFDDDVQK